MKTETNSMRIVKPEKESEKAVVEPQKEKAPENRSTNPWNPSHSKLFRKMPCSSAPRMYANCSTAATPR